MMTLAGYSSNAWINPAVDTTGYAYGYMVMAAPLT
jgi:hypothetical protein